MPSNCSQWQLKDIDLGAYDGQTILLRFTNINDYGNYLYLDNVSVIQNGLKLAVKLKLEGPYESSTDRMRDDLLSLIHISEPTRPY